MKRVGSVSWIVVLVSVVLTGCATVPVLEKAHSQGQAIIFGKVNVIVDGKHSKVPFLDPWHIEF